MQSRYIWVSFRFLSAMIIMALGLSACGLVGNTPHVHVGNTPQETARALLHDEKFGMLAVDKAMSYGDSIIPPLRQESENFSRLDTRTGEWVGRALGGIKSDLALNTAEELYGCNNQYARLSGALALAIHHQLKDLSYLIGVVSNDKSDEGMVMLASTVLGEVGDKAATPCLQKLLQERKVNYWIHADAWRP